MLCQKVSFLIVMYSLPCRFYLFLETPQINEYLFVCVEVLWPSQPNGVMSSAVSLPNHIFTGLSPLSTVHILPPETDNCQS